MNQSYIEKLEWLLYECLVELSYAQSAEDISQVSSAKGKAIVYAGMELLRVEDLSAPSVKIAREK